MGQRAAVVGQLAASLRGERTGIGRSVGCFTWKSVDLDLDLDLDLEASWTFGTGSYICDSGIVSFDECYVLQLWKVWKAFDKRQHLLCSMWRT